MKLRSYGLILGLLLIASASCSKRITERKKTTADSLVESSSQKVFIDTSKLSEYTRLTGYLPSPKLVAGSVRFDPFNSSRTVTGIGTWSPEDLIRYLAEIQGIDSIPGRAPFILERWTVDQKGITETRDTISRKQVKKTEDSKATEKKPDMSWKFGVALIIVAIILIIILRPRKSQ